MVSATRASDMFFFDKMYSTLRSTNSLAMFFVNKNAITEPTMKPVYAAGKQLHPSAYPNAVNEIQYPYP